MPYHSLPNKKKKTYWNKKYGRKKEMQKVKSKRESVVRRRKTYLKVVEIEIVNCARKCRIPYSKTAV